MTVDKLIRPFIFTLNDDDKWEETDRSATLRIKETFDLCRLECIHITEATYVSVPDGSIFMDTVTFNFDADDEGTEYWTDFKKIIPNIPSKFKRARHKA